MKIKLKIEPKLAPLLQLMADESKVTIEKMVQICIGSVVAGWIESKRGGNNPTIVDNVFENRPRQDDDYFANG